MQSSANVADDISFLPYKRGTFPGAGAHFKVNLLTIKTDGTTNESISLISALDLIIKTAF